MILVDTSVWVDHLRAPDRSLIAALEEGDVLAHPFVIGELACGNLRNRDEVLGLLEDLPRAREATHDEVMAMIERRRLMGAGIGYVDAHLLAAAALTPSTSLMTRDRRLASLARRLLAWAAVVALAVVALAGRTRGILRAGAALTRFEPRALSGQAVMRG